MGPCKPRTVSPIGAIVMAAVTSMVAEPDLVGSCTEVAVIVSGPAVPVAVKKPVVEIRPADADQVTMEVDQPEFLYHSH